MEWGQQARPPYGAVSSLSDFYVTVHAPVGLVCLVPRPLIMIRHFVPSYPLFIAAPSGDCLTVLL
jgi:hypothetical protein